MKGYISLFGRRWKEPDVNVRNTLVLKRRRPITEERLRYLSNYIKEKHGVEVDLSPWGPEAPPKPAPCPKCGHGDGEAGGEEHSSSVTSVMEGLDSETDVELLRRKIVRLADALTAAEKERDALRSRLAKVEAAFSNIDNVILSDLDTADDKEKKLELLKVVFEENKQLRKDLGNE